MKKIVKIVTVLFGMTLLLQNTASAQEEKKKDEVQTLFGTERPSVRGFVTLNYKMFELNNQAAVMSGGGISLGINHKFNIGFFGYGMVSNVYSNYVDVNFHRYFYEAGIGGVRLEPVIWSNKLVHLTIPVELGGGVMSINRSRLLSPDGYEDEWNSSMNGYDGFSYAEPGLNFEVNLFKHLRFDAGVGYRFTNNINLAGTDAFPLSGITGNMSLKLGWF